jgi:NADPH:quinone reductase-like Zn-dependent oxidoreductase
MSPEQMDRLVRTLRPGRAKPAVKPQAGQSQASKQRFDPAKHKNFSLAVGVPGLLESLSFVESGRELCQPHEVEIEVFASGLNFRDVMIALGIYPTAPGSRPSMGGEVAGKITAVGATVQDFKVGDEVIAAVAEGFRRYVTASSERVVPKPASMSFDQAAGIPVVYLTCMYGLCHLANMAKGERVLIHSAAGGVGVCAIQIAQWIGADIFATVGTPEKRTFLQNLGVEKIMNSRSLDFAEEIMTMTNDEGVDIVLNSLAGEAIDKSLECLRPYGRFIELGKRDLMENRPIGLMPFARGVSFTGVELSWLEELRPGLIKRLLLQTVDLFNQQIFKPMPSVTYPISKASEAFSFMTRGTHIGKIVLQGQNQEVFLGPN